MLYFCQRIGLQTSHMFGGFFFQILFFVILIYINNWRSTYSFHFIGNGIPLEFSPKSFHRCLLLSKDNGSNVPLYFHLCYLQGLINELYFSPCFGIIRGIRGWSVGEYRYHFSSSGKSPMYLLREKQPHQNPGKGQSSPATIGGNSNRNQKVRADQAK